MSTRKQDKAAQNFQQIWQLSKTNRKEQMQWLLRGLLVIGRQPGLSGAGFVLPTVAMVSLVVVLLTTAILIRSFDRSKNASNVRVNEAVLNAATPALDRARAKIDALFADPTLPRETPSDRDLYKALNSIRYNFGDETRLKIVHDIDNNGVIQKPLPGIPLESDETLTTAWKFAVDTDNNGKFDSYTLYSIYFRSPTRDTTNGRFNRPRNPLEARTPPMSGNIGDQCQNATSISASLIGDSSWYKSGAKLTKSFFVYTVTVPITDIATVKPTANQNANQFEIYKGNRGFSALEFQQDRSRIPLINNAVLFQDDLELTPGSAFRLNGRVFTNANLLIGGHGGAINVFQVSSKNSCFYSEENSKITVGGNVGTGNVADTTDQTPVTVDLFKGFGNNPGNATINGSNRSTNSPGGAKVAYNDTAYNRRIALMKQRALAYHPGFDTNTKTINPPPTVASVNNVTQYPQEVKDGFKAKIEATGGNSLNAQDVLADQIEIYLKDRTRRVPYAEVADPITVDYDYNIPVFEPGTIEPIAIWREPTDANTQLTLNTANLAQTQPEKQRNDGVETYLGDRVYVGNNLPAYWKKEDKYVTGSREQQLVGNNINWTDPNTEPRYRTTQVVPLPDLGISERSGFWENAAAQQPPNNLSSIGGLRVITGAGIYVDDDGSATVNTPTPPFYPRSTNSFLPPPTWDSFFVPIPAQIPKFTTASISSNNDNIVAWPDSMPMTGGPGENRKSDLQMRATAVYHYRDAAYTDTNYINRTPTACVSSYYDPTNGSTARNPVGLPDVSGIVNGAQPAIGVGRSNNGVVYPAPYNSDSARIAAVSANRARLNRQARLVFPNGRIVNQPLRDALRKIDANGTRSLADNSAIDTAICAIGILNGTLLPNPASAVPHGAIEEASFLDARQVKAIDLVNSDLNGDGLVNINDIATDYDLQLEQRQPLEIRVTDINLGQLAGVSLGGTPQEFLLPNSGIIYASRDDALPDLSNKSAEKELLSPVDFRLDPTRRPNGIRLINGSNLARVNTYREEEKGLILVTNLPAYIRGDFNLHQQPGSSTATEEFTETLDNNWGNFYTRNPALNNNFACRQGQSGCGSSGDQWRLATIVSDAITALSQTFVDGFRAQGDYDLRNNAGSSVTQAFKKNGFWDNSFVTSANWADTSSFPAAAFISSYLTNAITPIQRRVNFPEYLMEYCPKIPVSECKPSDWVLNASGTKATAAIINQPFNIATHQAGTTAQAASSNLQRYARRVAFKRKNNGTLELTQWPSPNEDQVTPIPLGINSAGNIAEFPYTSNALPRSANNALWFRTTNNNNGRPFCNGNNNPVNSGCTSDDRRYAQDKPLAYLGDTQLVSPPTPDIPGVASLNLPVGNPASSYIVCTNQNSQGSTTKPFIDAPSDMNLGKCADQPGNPMAQIVAARQGFLNLNPNASTTDNIVVPKRTNAAGAVLTGDFPPANVPGTTNIFTNNPPASPQPGYIVNVIDLSNNDFDTSATCTTIKLVGNENSIFVFRKTSNNELSFGGGNGDCGVQLVLDGVDPNNIFWAINSNVKWNAVDSAPNRRHKMAGTFITDSTGNPKWESVDFEDGGRLLGPNGVPSSSNFTNTRIYAIASSGQPSLVPVLQIHSPEGSPGGSTLNQGTADIQNQWLQAAGNNTTINAVFVSGNSPSRPAEESAGLHNFVRFLERWPGTTLNIKGGFIQLRRSAYATAPFSTVLAATAPLNNFSLSIFGYPFTRYRTGNGTPAGTLPYYGAPTRQWGFDVGILSQSPDLFGQRFTQQLVAPPDEFFREVSRDDIWVQRLLCAAQGSGTNYTYAIDTSELPKNSSGAIDCRPPSDYSD